MHNKQQSKDRLVRCPKCTRLLQEPEHIPLYTCGGCSTILQVKNYKGPQKNTALRSHEQNDVPKKNGVINTCDGGESSGSSRRSNSDHLSAQDEGRNSDGVENSRNTEQNGTASSFDDSPLSKESSSFKNKENGEIDDSKSEGNCSKSDKNGLVNCSYQATLLEESDSVEAKEGRKMDQSNSHERGVDDNPTSFGNEPQKLIKEVNSSNGDVNDEECNGIVDEDFHQKKIGDVNSDIEVFTPVKSIEEEDEEHEEKLIRRLKSAAAKNPAEHNASESFDHELSKEMGKIHNEGKHTREESMTQSSDIVKPTYFASENDASDQQQSKEIKISPLVQKHSCQNGNIHDLDEPEIENRDKEYDNGTDPIEGGDSSSTASPELRQLASENDAFNQEVSEETSMRLVEVHIQKDSINHLDIDGVEVEKSVKENFNATDPNNIPEQLGNVQISSARDLKNYVERGPTKVSRDLFQHQRNSFNDVNGISERNSEIFGDRSVHVDNEVGTFVQEIPESSSKRSPAYEGSASSFDGNDDKVAEQPPRVRAKNSAEWNGLPSEKKIFDDVRAPKPARSSSLMAIDEKLKRRMVEEEGPLEGIGVPRRFRPNRENFLPRYPYRRSSEIYRTGSTTNYPLHDPHHPYERRIHEAPLWREKEFLPTYYNSETSGEFNERPNHRSYMDIRRRTESWSQIETLPRLPYSGEIFTRRYPSMHRYPENRRWSAQLSPPAFYFHQGRYPDWESRWDPYDTYPASPQRFMESESSCAWGHDTISFPDDPDYKDQIMRRMYLREKRQSMKTPLHPIAGGTPFITCYCCLNILQLPQDFLFRRRRQGTHKLKCGACSRVLEFSLDDEGGLTPCETNNNLNRNLNSAMPSHSHVNHFRQSSLNSVDGRVLVSRDSLGASNREDRKLGPQRSSNGERMERLREDGNALNVRGRPPKVSWQLPARSKSPLHKLMGYSSPNELLTFNEANYVE